MSKQLKDKSGNNIFPNIETTIKLLGGANNETHIVNLTDDKLSNYDFLLVSSGYTQKNVSNTIIATKLFELLPNRNCCRQYVKTYNGYGFTSISYISDTSFQINGEVIEKSPSDSIGQDTTTFVYGLRINK